MDSVKDKIVLVTGGAQGIGKGLARACLQEGASVITTNLDPDVAASTAEELSSLGQIRALRCDATDRAAVDAMLDDIWSKEGPVDLVFCNAGSGNMQPILDTSMDDVHRQFAVNFDSCIHLAQAYTGRMLPEGREGHIMFTGSEHSLVLPQGSEPLSMGIYGGTKHALLILAEWLRYELRESPITVSMLLPGPVLTERLAGTFAALEANPDDPDLRATFAKSAEQALRDRFISTDECAAVALRGLKAGLFFIPAQPHIKADVDRRYREVCDAFTTLGIA
jgi:NAD(P)-dependent dehydrogenase (short-subunit alcohol dehydrogenase family)